MQGNEARRRHVLSLDGTPLAMCHWPGQDGLPTAFLGHSQPTHQGYLADLAQALNRAGLTVWTGDLRGHGASSSAATPLGRLHRETGWDDLIADATVMTQAAFRSVPWENRLLVMPNINALLTLEMLKGDPGLARSIVLISPPPNQKALSMLARAFVKGRMLVRDCDAPDELTLHHLYSFLGAQLDNSDHLLDVVTADRAIVDALVADPKAFVTPTLGYWAAIFKGFTQAWSWRRGTRIRKDTRILLLHGAEDPMMGMGRFVKPMSSWFAEHGASEVGACRVEGARSAIFIDERRLGVSKIILDWQAGKLPATLPQSQISGGMDELSSQMLEKFGFADPAEELPPDALVELCYNAIDDETRWLEMLYRVARDIARKKDMDDPEIEEVFARLMPHWERSYKVNRQIMTNAALGVVLQTVIARLDIGIALLTSDFAPLHFNDAYGEVLVRCGLAGLSPTHGDVAAATQTLLTGDFRMRAGSGSRETVVLFAGEPVGVYFRPPSLRQTGLRRGGPSGILVLRHVDPSKTNGGDERAPLLQLAYGLTAQESSVALRVCSGQSIEAAASELGISMNTMRTHLKRIYDKTGVSGQTGLASRILSGPIGWLGNSSPALAAMQVDKDRHPAD